MMKNPIEKQKGRPNLAKKKEKPQEKKEKPQEKKGESTRKAEPQSQTQT
jgi:hypothetical protein